MATHEERKYDVEMIRDFLDHVRFELDSLIAGGEPAAQRIGQHVQELCTKYGLDYLLFPIHDGTSKPELEQSQRCLRALQREGAESAIRALDGLEGVFNEALRSIGGIRVPSWVGSSTRSPAKNCP